MEHARNMLLLSWKGAFSTGHRLERHHASATIPSPPAARYGLRAGTGGVESSCRRRDGSLDSIRVDSLSDRRHCWRTAPLSPREACQVSETAVSSRGRVMDTARPDHLGCPFRQLPLGERTRNGGRAVEVHDARQDQILSSFECFARRGRGETPGSIPSRAAELVRTTSTSTKRRIRSCMTGLRQPW